MPTIQLNWTFSYSLSIPFKVLAKSTLKTGRSNACNKMQLDISLELFRGRASLLVWECQTPYPILTLACWKKRVIENFIRNVCDIMISSNDTVPYNLLRIFLFLSISAFLLQASGNVGKILDDFFRIFSFTSSRLSSVSKYLTKSIVLKYYNIKS